MDDIGFFAKPSSLSMRKNQKKDKELYQAVSLLKNIAILSSKKPIGADAAIGELALMTKLTKTAFLKMQAFLRQNEKEKAREVFVNVVGTKMSARVADILLFWDKIRPDELLNMLSALLESLQQERVTQEKIKDEKFSDLVYAPIFINILLLFLNFLFLAFLKTQNDSINMFFN